MILRIFGSDSYNIYLNPQFIQALRQWASNRALNLARPLAPYPWGRLGTTTGVNLNRSHVVEKGIRGATRVIHRQEDQVSL